MKPHGQGHRVSDEATSGLPAPPRRKPRPRLPAGWTLAAVAGIAAFALNLSLLQRPVDQVRVAVAVRDLDPGSVLAADRDLRFEPMAADDRLLASYVTRPEQADGAVVAAPIGAGSAVPVAALATGGPELRAMSLPVDRSHAAGGGLRRGDLVDVVGVVDGTARILLSGADVLAVPDARTGLGGAGGFHVVVAVAATEVLAVAEAMHAGSLEVVRITGAVPTGAGGDG